MTKNTIRLITLASMLTACGGPESATAVSEQEAVGRSPSRTITRTNRRRAQRAPSRKIVRIQTCVIDFANAFSLLLLPYGAADTFAREPWWFEPCGDFTAIRVEPKDYGHFHASFEDPTIDCFDLDSGSMGRTVGNDCDPIGIAYLEPRFLQGHTGSHRIKVHVEQNQQPKWFNFDGIRVRDNVPVLVRWRKPNSTTWQSVAVQPGVATFPNIINGVIEVEIVALNPQGPVMSIDDLVIDVPQLPGS